MDSIPLHALVLFHVGMVGPFALGTEIRAHTIDNVTVAGSEPFARGSIADIYVGEVARPGRPTQRTALRVALKVFTHDLAGETSKAHEQRT
ncbi:hypothetical protein AURDEDRAFT_167057 [Auricularia subglabra TFB-10046 SS5]|nr:hypothetical protein AURDEDRAFT_167057 [Auricularia subglabra TFB-10046 SS5]